jgi:hypothetical protein
MEDGLRELRMLQDYMATGRTFRRRPTAIEILDLARTSPFRHIIDSDGATHYCDQCGGECQEVAAGVQLLPEDE